MTAVSTQGAAGHERQERLEGAIRSVRTRVGLADRARVLLIGGGVLLPLGLVVIILGWYGASRTPYGVEQTPYLISGGMLGLGMVFVGGAMYVSYWLTQLVSAVRREGAATRQTLERVEAALSAAPTTAASAATASASPAAEPGVGRVVATATGTLFHRPDCSVMTGKRARTVKPSDPKLAPCKVCNPLG